MSWKVRYHDLFQSDVDSYIDWFDNARNGLGAEFAQAVKLALEKVASRPESQSFMFEDYRRALVSRFGILIPFLVEDGIIYVAGVVHAARACRFGYNAAPRLNKSRSSG